MEPEFNFQIHWSIRCKSLFSWGCFVKTSPGSAVKCVSMQLKTFLAPRTAGNCNIDTEAWVISVQISQQWSAVRGHFTASVVLLLSNPILPFVEDLERDSCGWVISLRGVFTEVDRGLKTSRVSSEHESNHRNAKTVLCENQSSSSLIPVLLSAAETCPAALSLYFSSNRNQPPPPSPLCRTEISFLFPYGPAYFVSAFPIVIIVISRDVMGI